MTDKVKYAGLDKAIAITAVAFDGEFDKGGAPYIEHCLHVMHQVKHLGVQAQIAAVFHDLLEDRPELWSAQKLIDAGFDPRTVEVVVLLTHERGVPYVDYIRRLSVSIIAIAIKMADLRHNSDIHRMKPADILADGTIAPKAAMRLAKYYVAYAYLRGITD
jgi:(p)ppGpp synthase/HD superfamily hydrolase